MAVTKLPFISAVRLAPIDESFVVPTCLYYNGCKPTAGREAREQCRSPEFLIEDFKLDLGREEVGKASIRPSAVEHSSRRTAVGLAKDFFDQILAKISHYLEARGEPLPKRILIAEPLSLVERENHEGWLTNYRKSIRRALGSTFDEVDFLPEPFAVFQYYRYGVRHPVIAENRKHVALVLDFGGGTFDVSVIETTKRGDIRIAGGSNSKPLGAKSIAVGGYYINRLLAEDLLFDSMAKGVDKSDVRRALSFFNENRNPDEDTLSRLNDRQRAFFRHYKLLLQNVERAKVAICNGIANWSLAADLSGLMPYQIEVPADPFEAGSALINGKLDAGKLRKLYEERIWAQKLKEAISTTIKRASADLRGQDIDVVLLSGGSSNIRWLRPLMERDLAKVMKGAQTLELSGDFAEIVAKGLATECARRNVTEGEGDFRAVTYNRLCLALRADGGQTEIRRLIPVNEALRARQEDASSIDDGVLLPSASSLRGLVGQPLRWKVRLQSPPKRQLEYFFMRSSFDPDDIDSLQNPMDRRVQTPSGTRFQQAIQVELTVREDGTAEPRFIYGQNANRQEVFVTGRPFGMDMTFATSEVPGETYLGFDFGTSTSACSFVSSRDIQLVEDRSRSPAWRDLSDLVAELPYPAAAPLASYISETDERSRHERGREAVEAMLTLAAYISYSEYCTLKVPNTAAFKNLAHRSAGPLWAMIKQCVPLIGKRGVLTKQLIALLDDSSLPQIDDWVSAIANSKHGKQAEVDYLTFLGIVGNYLAKIFEHCQLGVFEGVTPKRFGRGPFTGIFRSFKGASRTFITVYEYEGGSSFSNADVYLVDPAQHVGLCLSPLYVWGLGPPDEDTDLFEFDTPRKDRFSFKAVQFRREQLISSDGSYQEIWEILNQMRECDIPSSLSEGLKLEMYGFDADTTE